MMFDKQLIEILKLKKSIEKEKEYLAKNPNKKHFCDLRLQHLHGKIAKIYGEREGER